MKKIKICFLSIMIILGLCSCSTLQPILDDGVSATGNFVTNLEGVSYGILAGSENNIYYQNYTIIEDNERYSGLFQNNREGTSKKLLYDDCGGMINVYNEKIYFRNYDFSKVLSYDLKSGKTTTLLSDYFVQYILVYQDYIYFIHMDFENNKKCTLYQCDLNGENVKLCEEGIVPYYLDVADNQLLYIKYDEKNNQEILCAYENETEMVIYSWEYQEDVSVKALKDSFVILSSEEIVRYTYEGEKIETKKAEKGKRFSSLAYNGSLYYIAMDMESGYKVIYEYLPNEEDPRKIGSVSNGLLLVDADSIYSCGWEGEIECLVLQGDKIIRKEVEA